MQYPCFVFKQRASEDSPDFCIFEAPVGELMSLTTIPRLSPESVNGIQREKNDFRVKGIKKFLDDETKNTIPTAIVVAFAPSSFNISTDASTGRNVIELDPSKQGDVFVVDGQHRLHGLNLFDPSSRVPVVGILNASDEEKAFQFIVINNKASKVAPDHIRALTLSYANANLETRLKTAKLSMSKNVIFVGLSNEMDGSPFKNKLDLPTVEADNRWISPSAIESCINYIQSKKIISIDDDESLIGFFLTIWKFIESKWPQAFSKNSKLLTKVGLVTMNKYMVDSIDLLAGILDDTDLSNEADVNSACERILKMQSMDFWLSEWSLTISDSKVVKDQIFDSLRRVQQNLKQNLNWFDELPIIESVWVNEPPQPS